MSRGDARSCLHLAGRAPPWPPQVSPPALTPSYLPLGLRSLRNSSRGGEALGFGDWRGAQWRARIFSLGARSPPFCPLLHPWIPLSLLCAPEIPRDPWELPEPDRSARSRGNLGAPRAGPGRHLPRARQGARGARQWTRVASADRGAWPGPAPREEALGEAAGDAVGRPREARGLGWAALAPSAAPGGRAVRGSGAASRGGSDVRGVSAPNRERGGRSAGREGGRDAEQKERWGAHGRSPRARRGGGAPDTRGYPRAPLRSLRRSERAWKHDHPRPAECQRSQSVSARPLPRTQLFPEFGGPCQIPPGIERRWGR